MTTTTTTGHGRMGPLTAIKLALDASAKQSAQSDTERGVDVFAVMAQGFWWWVRGVSEADAASGTGPRSAA